MKICMLTTGHNAMDDRIFYKEACSLRKVYDEVYVIAPDKKKNYNVNGINIIGITEPSSLSDRFKIIDELIKEAIKVNADVYHFHDYEILSKILMIKKKLPNAKIIYDVHEHYPDMIRMSKKVPKAAKGLLGLIVDKYEIHISKKLDFIITADDAVKERFKQYVDNVEVIYNFSDFDFSNDIYIEKEYDLIYQGGITLERGIFEVVKSVKIAKEKFDKIKMVFVGPFNDVKAKQMVNDYIEKNGLNNNIQFTGNVPHKDVEMYIRKSKIGIVTLLPYPKYFKNIPIKQFEYMSCGIPVIGSDLPPIKKFVTSYNSGIIVDPTKPEEIANAISKILDNEELRIRLGNNGIKAVKEAYNWGNMEQYLYKIYSKMEWSYEKSKCQVFKWEWVWDMG